MAFILFLLLLLCCCCCCCCTYCFCFCCCCICCCCCCICCCYCCCCICCCCCCCCYYYYGRFCRPCRRYCSFVKQFSGGYHSRVAIRSMLSRTSVLASSAPASNGFSKECDCRFTMTKLVDDRSFLHGGISAWR